MQKALIFLCGVVSFTLFGMETRPMIKYNLNDPEDSRLFYASLKDLGMSVSEDRLYPKNLPPGWQSNSCEGGTAIKRSLEIEYIYEGKIRFSIQEYQLYFGNSYKAIFYQDT